VYGQEEGFIQQVEGRLNGRGGGALGDQEPRIHHHEGTEKVWPASSTTEDQLRELVSDGLIQD
jgi:hypothetical protein